MCCDCKNMKGLKDIVYCSKCPKFTCATCVRGHCEDDMILSLCELCDMKEQALAKYNASQSELKLIALCEEIEREHEAQIIGMLSGEESYELFSPEQLSNLHGDKKFHSVLDFWCDTAWWWDEKLADHLNEVN
jgi:hypothetical protein